jgi:carbon monoxide dehydrogenase subunit G
MKIAGTLTVPAAIDEVWAVFMDPTRLCPAVPGCEQVDQIDATHYDAVMAVKVQFMTVRARAHGTLLEAEPPRHLAVELVGEQIAMAGAFRALLAVDLAPVDEGTHLAYTLDVTMLGRLASLGEAIVRTTARRQAEQFAGNLAAMFAPPGDAAAP